MSHQGVRFLYSLFLLSNSLLTHASLSCIYSLLFAGYDWFVGSATRYSRIRDSWGKMRFCVFAWIKYAGISCISRTFAGKEYSLKPSFMFFTGKTKKLFLSSQSWWNMRRKIIKQNVGYPPKTQVRPKGVGEMCCLQLHGVFPKSSLVLGSHARGRITFITKKILFSTASNTRNYRYWRISATTRIPVRPAISHS